MQAQLDRQCPRDHQHELVQGGATAASAMYSPYMARLIAEVVVPSRGGARIANDKGRVGEDYSMPSRVGISDGRPEEGVAEVCFTPGKAPIGELADPWKQPLKGQLPPQHVKGPLGKEPSEAARRSGEAFVRFVGGKPLLQREFQEGR